MRHPLADYFQRSHGLDSLVGSIASSSSYSRNVIDALAVWPRASFVWMEVGRVDLCKACGFNYRDMERDGGIFLALAKANCRYKWPARFEDANTRIVIFNYEMRTAVGDRLLATGMTRRVYVTSGMQRTRLPRKYYSMFGIPHTEPCA
jgi:acyl-CoA thioesterase FadM